MRKTECHVTNFSTKFSLLLCTFATADITVVHSMCRTTRKRLANQSRNAANCLLSDSSDENDSLNRALDSEKVDVDVSDDRPAIVELMSCNSSFSDCSLPCHELVTCSPPTQLAKGHVEVDRQNHVTSV